MSSTAHGPQAASACDSKQHLRRLLSEALEIVDSLALPPEVGARLQEVIDMTSICTGDGQRDVPIIKIREDR